MNGRLFRRIRRLSSPVVLAQRSMGFWVAAVLIFCWQGTRAVQAAISSQGYSEDDHFRLEWDYDLGAGTGTIWIHGLDNSDPGESFFAHMTFDPLSLYTRGMTLDSITATCYPYTTFLSFAGPIAAGTQGAMDLYEYRNGFLAGDPWIECVFSKSSGSDPTIHDYSAQIDVTFPTTGVRLWESSLEYSGLLSCAAELVLTDQQMPFVSVEVIPEPSTIALLGLGGLAAARRRKKD